MRTENENDATKTSKQVIVRGQSYTSTAGKGGKIMAARGGGEREEC